MLSGFPDNGWKIGSIDSLLKNPQHGHTIVQQHVRRVAVKDLMLSQEDVPKRHRSACKISRETAILHSNVHSIIIHRDLQLKCFKRRRAQLLCEANHISRLTR